MLRPSGVAGFTCWVRPGWFDSLRQVFPTFELPARITNSWNKPDFLKATFIEIGFSDVRFEPIVFKNRPGDFAEGEGGLEAFLEFVKVALPMLKEEENLRKYEDYIKKEYEAQSGGMEMTWEALIIIARK